MAQLQHRGRLLSLLVPALVCCSAAWGQVAVPEAPPSDAKAQDFRDGHFGVQFEVPGGWTLSRRDREVSTFHLDARTASRRAQMRGVVTIQFNPYPYSTFSGAHFYYSVEPHSTDAACAREARAPLPKPLTKQKGPRVDTQDIDGMSFVHGHDEYGQICVEARDEVYTAYRRGSCYRFDLAMNTFCAVSSGAADLTESQVEQIDQRMTDILSTVKLAWSKGDPHPVPAPKLPPPPEPVPQGPPPVMPVAE